jgi:hypothetical protein
MDRGISTLMVSRATETEKIAVSPVLLGTCPEVQLPPADQRPPLAPVQVAETMSADRGRIGKNPIKKMKILFTSISLSYQAQ